MSGLLKLNTRWMQHVSSFVAISAGLAGIFLMARFLSSLPIGTAYAAGTGISTIGLVVIGMVSFHEGTNWMRLFFLGSMPV